MYDFFGDFFLANLTVMQYLSPLSIYIYHMANKCSYIITDFVRQTAGQFNVCQICSVVTFYLCICPEISVTIWTFYWWCCIVSRPHVYMIMWVLRKFLSTCLKRVWPFAGMHSLVWDKSGWLSKRLLAKIRWVWPYVNVFFNAFLFHPSSLMKNYDFHTGNWLPCVYIRDSSTS